MLLNVLSYGGNITIKYYWNCEIININTNRWSIFGAWLVHRVTSVPVLYTSWRPWTPGWLESFLFSQTTPYGCSAMHQFFN